jgi:asparagine synthase (glutamine-hydrolysing)
MPGIAGLLTRMPSDRAQSELRQMLGVMRHESFYVARIWTDDTLGVYVGWTSHGGSFDDTGPLHDESGDVVLVFSGQDFPADGTIGRLKSQGHRLGEGEPNYLVHLYEEDPSFPACLNGFFHGVLADRRRRTVTLFNDRFGMHRLYTHETKDGVYFAAEIKAILAVRPELRSIDPRGLGESTVLGCVLEDRTLFAGIHALPGASAWQFESGRRARKTTYFQPQEWEAQPRLDGADFYRETRDVFARILPRYFAGRDRIGMSLTGGLDTRMIVAWRTSARASLPCYTWGGAYRDSQDVVVARRIARSCGQPHDVISVGDELLSRFAEYADRAVCLGDGRVNASAAADVYLNERARAIAPIRMTGLYGGEVLRGVRSFKPRSPLPGLFRSELVPFFEQARRTYEGLLECHPLSFAVFRQVPWHQSASLSLEATQVTMRTPFLDNELVKTLFRAPSSSRDGGDLCRRLIADGHSALARIPTDRGLGDGTRLSGTVSHAFQELLFKAEYAYDAGMPQWLARIDRLAQPLHVERLLLGRHNFLHFRVWYRDRLAKYVREMLLDQKSLSRTYVDRKAVERVVAGHISGDRNYTAEIHQLLGLELLHRNFVDGPNAAANPGSPAEAKV